MAVLTNMVLFVVIILRSVADGVSYISDAFELEMPEISLLTFLIWGSRGWFLLYSK